MADPGLFVVSRACAAGLVCAHERSRKRSGQRNPPFKIIDSPLKREGAYSPTCTHLFMHIDTQVA